MSGIETAESLDKKGELSWKHLEEEAIKSLKSGQLKVLNRSQTPQYLNGG